MELGLLKRYKKYYIKKTRAAVDGATAFRERGAKVRAGSFHGRVYT